MVVGVRNLWSAGVARGPLYASPVLMVLLPVLFEFIRIYREVVRDPEARVFNVDRLAREYDFIIIGGGTAGSVVANRLSEVPHWRVLLLEAGQDESEASDVPVLAFSLQMGSFDWAYKTEPQPGRACLGHVGGRCNWPRGKVLGGSSVLNYMLYVRGNKEDYNDWERLGNPGWGYEEALYYFKKSEDNRNPYLAADTRHHATGGYLTVQEPPWRTPLATAFVEAGVEMGYEHRDCNGARQTGFMLSQGTVRRGSRCSTAKAFLRPVRDRTNLDIALGSHVTKVMIDPRSKQATGVKLVRGGRTFVVKARKEVVLSAGSLNTPQILMLSGVGPAEHLRHHGLPIISDLPVGENLMDHYGTMSITATVTEPVSLIEERYLNLPAMAEYVVKGQGPLTVLGGVESMAWINTKFANTSQDRPDIEIMFVSGGIASDSGTGKIIHGLTDRTFSTYAPLRGRDTLSFLTMLTRPKSRGSVKLRSRNPFDKPVFEAGYFKHPEDIKILVEGMKFSIALTKTKAFGKFGAKLWTERLIPGCEYFIPFSDQYLECAARQYTSTIYHHVGSAKMGPRSDPEAVVDPQLMVYGVSGLRVVDASIMPKVVSGNTNAPVVMIAEKASDMIKQKWLGHNVK